MFPINPFETVSDSSPLFQILLASFLDDFLLDFSVRGKVPQRIATMKLNSPLVGVFVHVRSLTKTLKRVFDNLLGFSER